MPKPVGSDAIDQYTSLLRLPSQKMNASDPTQRSRGPPNGASSGLNPRPSTAQESHNGVSPARSGGSQLSRAEQFEDEKRRIVESCFGKTDLDGASMPRQAFASYGAFPFIEDLRS